MFGWCADGVLETIAQCLIVRRAPQGAHRMLDSPDDSHCLGNVRLVERACVSFQYVAVALLGLLDTAQPSLHAQDIVHQQDDGREQPCFGSVDAVLLACNHCVERESFD